MTARRRWWASPGRRGARPPASFGSQAATGPGPRRDALLHGGGAGLCPGGDRDPGRRGRERGGWSARKWAERATSRRGRSPRPCATTRALTAIPTRPPPAAWTGRATRRCWSAIWPGCAGRPPRATRITISSGRTAWRGWGPPGHRQVERTGDGEGDLGRAGLRPRAGGRGDGLRGVHRAPAPGGGGGDGDGGPGGGTGCDGNCLH